MPVKEICPTLNLARNKMWNWFYKLKKNIVLVHEGVVLVMLHEKEDRTPSHFWHIGYFMDFPDSKITEVSGIFPKFFSDFIKDFVRKN